ncbi:hypothetical protein CLOM_g24223 [Closterium sp. NIES-68]|nr:hypothetical protein CLOM_g24223 [Closterium sp. NIES-68]
MASLTKIHDLPDDLLVTILWNSQRRNSPLLSGDGLSWISSWPKSKSSLVDPLQIFRQDNNISSPELSASADAAHSLLIASASQRNLR